MKEIDCRKCKNLNQDKSGCVFGKNPDEAVKKCAESNFAFYAPDKKVMT